MTAELIHEWSRFGIYKDELDNHFKLAFALAEVNQVGSPGMMSGVNIIVGTANGYSAAGPLYSSVFPKIDALPISQQWQAKMDELRELSPDELREALHNVPIEYREYAIKSVEENWTPAAFLDFYKDWKYLEFEVEAFMLSEFYVSYFVEDHKGLEEFYSDIISTLINQQSRNI